MGKSNFISAFALADFSVANILMALPLATTELPTCNYSLVIKTKNGVCQSRATPFWAADNSPRLSICSAPLRSGKATFLLPLVPVVSLWLLLFLARPSPLPGAPACSVPGCTDCNVTAPERRGERTDVAVVASLRGGGGPWLTLFLEMAHVGLLGSSLE